jgi:HEAT repeats
MRHLWLIALLLGGLAAPAEAGRIFGRKKEKPAEPSKRVPELIATLRGDKDSDKRARAAVEVRQYDPAAYPEIVPALISALQSDARAGVRVEAAQSLGRVRPVAQQVGDALEQAVSRDSSMRVRIQVRSQLLQYQLAGYRNGKRPDAPPAEGAREPAVAQADRHPPPVVTTAAPPVAKEQQTRALRPALQPVPEQPPARGSQSLTPPTVPTTQEPPLAPPETKAPPVAPPETKAPPAAPPAGEGPELP